MNNTLKKGIVIGIGTLALGSFFLGGNDTVSKSELSAKFNASQVKNKYVLNDAELVKKDIKNTELDKYKGEPKDEIEVTLGDNSQMVVGAFGGGEKEFKPDIELKRWNEVSFKLKTDKLLKNKKNKKLSFEGEKVKYTTDKMSFEMYAPDDESYKYVWYLNEKPATNKIEFEIESEGLNFFYQPPLTDEYKNGYSEEFQKDIVVTETQVKDLDGNVLVERPENVVGSYQIYHSSKGGIVDSLGKDYKTGKAFSILRPKIIDNNGNWVWGELFVDINAGIYQITIPQDFLDKSTYPIRCE